jgi:hypothetical protein
MIILISIYIYIYIYYHISIIIIETIIIDGLFYPHLISFHGHQWVSDLRCNELLQQNSMGLTAAASFAKDDGIVHPKKHRKTHRKMGKP